MAIIHDLKLLAEHKKLGIFPTFLAIDMSITAGTKIDIIFSPPKDWYIICIKEVHNVKEDVFKHTCYKDGKLVLPETLITGANMVWEYAEPLIVKKVLHGIVENTTTADERFILHVDVLYVPSEVIEKLERGEQL